MYHVELRQFPHNFCHFNMTGGELRATVLNAWAQGEWIELGERKWNPHQASLTVIEGPRIPVEQLSMGRGWGNARRHGEDVTEKLLAQARTAGAASVGVQVGGGLASNGGPGSADPGLAAGLAADSIGLEVLSRLSAEPEPIALAWRLACERYPRERASDCLKLAEGAISSLARAGLIVVVARDEGDAERMCEPGAGLEERLHAIDSWQDAEGRVSVCMRRA